MQPHDLAVEEFRRLVPGGEDDPSGADADAAVGAELDAVLLRRVRRHPGPVVHLEAGGPRLRQELVGQAVGVELAGHGREQRRRAGEGEPVPDIALVQQLDLDAGRTAREPLALEHGAVAAPARQVEAPGRAPGAVVVAGPGQIADAAHGIEAEAVAPDGVVSADAIDQIDQVRVDLVLDQGGGGGGAAVRDLVGLEQHGRDAFPGEPMRHQGAGDPAADDGHVAPAVLVKSGVDGGKAVHDGPERTAAGEIHPHRLPTSATHTSLSDRRSAK